MVGILYSFLLGPGLFSEAMLLSGSYKNAHLSLGLPGFLRLHPDPRTEVRTFVTYYGERLYIEPSVDEGFISGMWGPNSAFFPFPVKYVGG